MYVIPKRFKNLLKLSDGATSIVYSGTDSEDNDKRKVIKINKNSSKFDFDNEIIILKIVLELKSDYFIQYVGKIICSKSNTIPDIVTNYSNLLVGNLLSSQKKLSRPYPISNITPSNNSEKVVPLGIITNYIPETVSLYDMILTLQNFPFIAHKILKQLLSALNLLHSNNIIHRDIKLENILFCKVTGKITLIDFGSASIYSEDPDKCINLDNSVPGTICNFSPEIVYACRENHSILYLSDIWAVGSVFYTILTEQFIVDDRRYYKLSQIVDFFHSVTGEFQTTIKQNINKIGNISKYQNFSKIILACLTFEYINRPHAGQLLEMM